MERWYYPIVRVPQVDNYGCGVAAVATLCGATYERTRAECFPNKQKFKARDMMVTAEQMQEACRRLGIATTLVGWDVDFRLYRLPAILTVAWCPTYAHTGVHCVVWNPFSQVAVKRYGGVNQHVIDPGDDKRSDENYLDLARQSNFHIILATGRARAKKAA
jgi:hypothetical protein